MKKFIYSYIPKNLDIEKLLIENPPNFKVNKNKLLYILGLPFEIASYDHDKYSDDGFIPINAKKLQEVGIRDFPKYRDWLLANKIWESNMQYIVGKHARSYRFTSTYQVSLKEEISKNESFIKRISKKQQEINNTIKKYPQLFKWMEGLEINKLEALKYIDLVFEIDSKKKKVKKNKPFNEIIPKCNVKGKKKNKDSIKNPLLRHQFSFVGINKLFYKQIDFKQDTAVERLHTNLTNIKSELRQFITYKGELLVNIDIKNSQPFISTLLLNAAFWLEALGNSAKTVNFNIKSTDEAAKSKFIIEETMINPKFLQNLTISNETSFNINSLTPNNKIALLSNFNSSSSYPCSNIMLADLIETIDNEDVILFIKLCEEGTFYEYLEEQFKQIPDSLKLNIKTRKELKEVIFTVLFTSNKFIGQKRALPKKIFKGIFPNVYKIFAMTKKKAKKILPKTLQNLESKMVLDRITRRISREKPDLPIFTIHDSITTTVGNEEYVKKVMEEEIIKAIGIKPCLSMDYWSPSNIDWDKLYKEAEEVKNT